MKRVASDGGFTLLELVFAMAIMVIATAAIFTVMNPARGVFQAQPEVYDLQQRLRVAVDTLQKDLIMAGAGMYMGPSTGALNRYVAPVMPYRVGESAPDVASGVFYRPDTISIVYVPATAAQTTVRKAVLSGSTLSIQADTNCGPVHARSSVRVRRRRTRPRVRPTRAFRLWHGGIDRRADRGASG